VRFASSAPGRCPRARGRSRYWSLPARATGAANRPRSSNDPDPTTVHASTGLARLAEKSASYIWPDGPVPSKSTSVASSCALPSVWAGRTGARERHTSSPHNRHFAIVLGRRPLDTHAVEGEQGRNRSLILRGDVGKNDVVAGRQAHFGLEGLDDLATSTACSGARRPAAGTSPSGRVCGPCRRPRPGCSRRAVPQHPRSR